MRRLPCLRTLLLEAMPTYAGAAVALLLSVAGPASARTWRVQKDGSGDYTTIQPAVDAAAPGDTVLIGPGRYLEHAPYDFGVRTEDTYVVVPTPNLTLRGTATDSVIIGPQVYDWPTAFEPNGIQTTGTAPDVVLENLTIENIPDGLGLEAAAVVRACNFTGCRTAISSFAVAPPTFSDCIFTRSREFGVFLTNTGSGCRASNLVFDGALSGIILSHAQDVTVSHCEFRGGSFLKFQLTSSGVVADCSFSGGGIIVRESAATLSRNYIGPRTGTCLDISSSQVAANANVFAGGADATILLRDGSDVTIVGNHILHAGSWSVRAFNYTVAGHTLDLRNNWWGSPYGSDIRRWIYDGWDDDDVQVKVLYYPYAEQPVPDRAQSFGQLKATFEDR